MTPQFNDHQLICPSCLSDFDPNDQGIAHCLTHKGCACVLVAILCKTCAPNIMAQKGSPSRLVTLDKIMNSIDSYSQKSDEIQDRIAFTTLKTLILHGGNLDAAVRIGWSLPKREEYYEVLLISSTLVVVIEREHKDE